jgi:carboxyl-terminal processing protease
LTGALQDNNRAVVVGTTTYGKALVQSLYGLSRWLPVLPWTVAHYYTPDGTDISTRGITPDIEVVLSRRAISRLYLTILACWGQRWTRNSGRPSQP